MSKRALEVEQETQQIKHCSESTSPKQILGQQQGNKKPKQEEDEKKPSKQERRASLKMEFLKVKQMKPGEVLLELLKEGHRKKRETGWLRSEMKLHDDLMRNCKEPTTEIEEDEKGSANNVESEHNLKEILHVLGDYSVLEAHLNSSDEEKSAESSSADEEEFNPLEYLLFVWGVDRDTLKSWQERARKPGGIRGNTKN